ncbi:MAG: hypothetical protein J0I06_24555 [Planctomycetes bacterium]|nr:hypothetical protein [Planctomycetota bacterium]
MLLTHEELRASVAAIAADVAGAYARFEPAFLDTEVAGRFARLPGVHPAVAERLAAAHCSTSNDFGDGEKAAVLVACGIIRAAEERLPGEGRTNLAPAIDLAASRAAEAVERAAVPLRTPAEVERAATTAAAGDREIGAAICQALARSGPDGIVHVNRGEPDDPPGVTVRDGEETGPRGREMTVVVKGGTDAETADRNLRAVTALHAAVAAIARGRAPGGGAAYVLAAEALRDQANEDTITGLAALAVSAGLEVPLRVRAEAAGLDAGAILAAVRNTPDVAFDQTKPGLVPVAKGPLDAARIVQGAIREAGRAACDLLRRAL